jgi:hypothetical protein
MAQVAQTITYYKFVHVAIGINQQRILFFGINGSFCINVHFDNSSIRDTCIFMSVLQYTPKQLMHTHYTTY